MAEREFPISAIERLRGAQDRLRDQTHAPDWADKYLQYLLKRRGRATEPQLNIALTAGDLRALMAAQGARCAVVGTTLRTPKVRRRESWAAWRDAQPVDTLQTVPHLLPVSLIGEGLIGGNVVFVGAAWAPLAATCAHATFSHLVHLIASAQTRAPHAVVPRNADILDAKAKLDNG